MQTLSLLLDQITPDAGLQPRVDGIDPGHVKELEGVAEHWPPLKVVRQGERYLLVDGFHRFAAAQNLKLESISALILDVTEDEDLHALAFALNAAHGRPLTLSDRRAFASRLLRSHAEWSDREIGRRCGLVQPTIAKIRQDLERRADIQPSAIRVGRDGRAYPAPQAPASAGPVVALTDALCDVFTPAERRSQRQLVRYLEQLAAAREEQEGVLSQFEGGEEAAEACRAVLGTQAAHDLGHRLGWSSINILEIARNLGFREE